MTSKQENSVAGSSTISDSGFPKKNFIEPNHYLNRMFLDGGLSDITIKAFGGSWNLHKNILAANSPYFMSLFTKDWKDSKEKVLQLQIPDQKVTVEALNACLQSMYAFEVEFTKANVVSMLTAATFLQLDDQIQSCYEFIESMGMDYAVDYLGIVATYGGGKAVEKVAFECLENCLTLIKFAINLSKIDVELMTKLAESGNLFCSEEGSLYRTIVLWLFTKVTGLTFDENVQSQIQVDRAFDYFKNLEGSKPFLSTVAGKSYLDAFRPIRIRDLLITCKTVSSLQKEKIFPKKWIEKAALENWKRVEQVIYHTYMLSQSENNFYKNCIRCGEGCYKFQPFSKIFTHTLIGLELIAQKSENKWVFKIKRTKGEIDPKPDTKKELLVRGRVMKMTQSGKILFKLSSDIKKTSLKVGEEFKVLQTEEKLDDYAVNVSINYMF